MNRLPLQFANASLLVVLTLLTRSLLAEPVSVGGGSIDLEPPKGYCKASKDNVERPVVESLEKGAGTGALVLMVFAQCDELKSLRGGKIKNFTRYGQYVAPKEDDGTVRPQPSG